MDPALVRARMRRIEGGKMIGVGDVVRMRDATEQSLPSYRELRGRIVRVYETGSVRVAWFSAITGARLGTDVNPRDPTNLVTEQEWRADGNDREV